MRWLAGIFARAFVRRIAAIIAVAVLAYMGVGSAHAQTDRWDILFSSQGEAYSTCMADFRVAQAKANSIYPGRYDMPSCNELGGTWGVYQCMARSSTGRPDFMCRDNTKAYYYYPRDATCANRPSSTTPFLPVSGSTQCSNGCVAVYSQNADETSTRSFTGATCDNETFKNNCPTGSYYNGYLGVCEPVDKPCPPDQKKVDGQCVPDGKCPDGMVAVPGTTPGSIQQGTLYCKPAESECPPGNVKSPSGQCLPGDGQCAAGEAKGKDGTCKRDSDGDGTPDSEEGPDDPNKDSASGGDSCNAPPSCSGNAISCIQVKIQWRIDCNTRKNRNITGGTCAAMPICTGDKCDAMEYSSLLQQWKAACALEKLAKNGTGTPGDGEGCGAGDANCNGVADVLEGSGEASDPGDGTADVDGAKKWGIGVSAGMLDQGNIFGGGSCPQPPSFQLMGVAISGADFPHWCKAMAILRGLVLVFGAFTALKILMGGVG